jgi:hypothetical protein
VSVSSSVPKNPELLVNSVPQKPEPGIRNHMQISVSTNSMRDPTPRNLMRVPFLRTWEPKMNYHKMKGTYT